MRSAAGPGELAIISKGSPKMKTLHLPLATVIVGALGVAYAGCATQSELNPPDSTNTNGGGAFNAAGGSTSGPGGSSGGPPVAYYAGAPAATYAGAPGASGAFSAAGAFGSSAGAPVISGAAGSAAAGAPALGGCVAAMGTIADLPIDDLEDVNNAIMMIGHRAGFWYTYNDGMGTQTPTANKTIPFLPEAGGHASMFAAHTVGTAFPMYAGMGFDLNNTVGKSCVYDASAYAGIKFWAKGNVAIKAMVKMPATTAATSDSGTCLAKCEDHYYLKPAPTLGADWAQYTITFGSASFAQEGWGQVVPTFDKTQVIGVQFQVVATGIPPAATTIPAFDFSIDDVAFY
jgi:hypothetical protein